jgi:hypothetical protein
LILKVKSPFKHIFGWSRRKNENIDIIIMSIIVYQSPYAILNKTLLDQVRRRGERLDQELVSLFISSIERGEKIKDKYNSRLINRLCGSDYVYIYNLDGGSPSESELYLSILDGEPPSGSGDHMERWIDQIGHQFIQSVRFDYGGETYRLCELCGSGIGLSKKGGAVWCGLC